MTARAQSSTRTPDSIAAFVRLFFGHGNAVWPDLDPTSRTGRNLAPYLQVLHDNGDVPVVLPRRWPTPTDRLVAYVIAQDRAHATAVAELLTAFIGPTYTRFDGRPARLNTNDPVDRAVLDFAGDGTTFTLWTPLPHHEGAFWNGLRLMQQTVAKRPTRAWHVPKPVGRLLAEFEVALAAGENSASARMLEHLTATGGLTGPNLAHLRIKRLARLGRDRELLQLPDLADVIAADPPTPVKDAILTAIYSSALAEHLDSSDIPAARTALIESGTLVPALIGSDLAGLGAPAVTVVALAAWIRGDAQTLDRLSARPIAVAQIADLAPALAVAITPAASAPSSPTAPTTTVVPSQRPDHGEVGPTSWPELITAVLHDHRGVATLLENETWRDWPPPTTTDETLAGLLQHLDDKMAARAWSVVGAFVEADGYGRPSARTAQELINIALVLGSFSPGDLAGLVALTEIVLRTAPDRGTYTALLDDLRADTARWVGPERATVALDLADLLVRAASPDHEARLRLSVALLGPLRTHATRLDPDQSSFARQLSEELQTGLDWPAAVVTSEAAAELHAMPRRTVLLYSLDEGALSRAARVLEQLAPTCVIQLSHDLVGGNKLRQRARNADLIVLATRCATHAATGFIRANAGRETAIAEADGSGSASLLRAAVAGLRATASSQDDAP